MCVTILKGLRAQLIKDRRTRPGERCIFDMMLGGDVEIEMFEASQAEKKAHAKLVGDVSCHQNTQSESSNDHGLLMLGYHAERFIDDLAGLPLPPDLCRAARQKEIDYFKSKGVWSVRSMNEARRVMGRSPISVRWVETSRGDDDNPNIRSRWFVRYDRPVRSLFSPLHHPWSH